MPESGRWNYVEGDLSTFAPNDVFDCAIASYTFIEDAKLINHLTSTRSLLDHDGILIVVMPDCLEDVIDKCDADDDTELLRRFARQDFSIAKIDPFTSEIYPFVAIRMTRLIEVALQAGFCLIGFQRLERKGKAAFMASFKKLASDEE